MAALAWTWRRGTLECVAMAKKPTKDWSAIVERLMARYGLTQKAIGQRLGVSPQNVNDWVNGRRIPPRCVQKLMAMMDNGDDLTKYEKI